MEKQPAAKYERIFAGAMIFLFASGLVAHAVPSLRPLTASTTDLFLLLINGTLLWLIVRNNSDNRLWFWSLSVYVFTFTVEAVGVATGAVFGEYAYGAGMKVQWIGVPLVIALNWTLLTLGVNDLASRITSSPWLRAAAAALLIAAYDWFIEPVAIGLDYWQWSTGSDIPVQNYVAWAVVAFAASLPLHLLRIRFRHWLLPLYLGVQWFYFVLMGWVGI
jgi:putative membrane protein